MIDEDKIADNARWESYYDRKDQQEERDIRAQLDDLRLDGSFDFYLREFLSLTDGDIEKLSLYYDCNDLCRPLADAWCKAAANLAHG